MPNNKMKNTAFLKPPVIILPSSSVVIGDYLTIYHLTSYHLTSYHLTI